MSRPNASTQKTLITQALRAENNVSSAISQSQALEAAIDAAEHYMKALRLATVQKDKQSLDAKCKEWLTRAERIKTAKDWQPAACIQDRTSRPPISTRKLTTREEIILLEGAKLNGFIFPPWADPLNPLEFRHEDGAPPFTDKPDLHLSSLQRSIFNGWKRPAELLATKAEKTDGTPLPAILVSDKMDLVQDVLTDCSVVASLCATTSRLERGLDKVFLHNEDVTGFQLWQRLYRAFHHGDVLLTIGTGKLTEREETELGLVSEHDYAILDMKEAKGRRQMLVKNPWAGSDAVPEGTGHILASQKHLPPVPPGTFWMDCDNVLQNFENLYLNWNPQIFRCREDIHFTWDLSEGRGVAGCFVKNPQFALSTETGGTVWLLLGKHFETIEHPSSDDENPHVEPGFISLYAFNAGGKKVSLSDGALYRGPYVDSPNTLMRLEVPPKATYTVVVSEQSLASVTQNFTLSAVSTSPIQLSQARNKHMCVRKLQGTWTPSSAGGNAESARYPFNPQFSLEVSDTTDISLLLECPDTELATHVKLFYSNGARVSRIRSRDIITDSGDYRRGGSLAEKCDLEKGSYTIVCSTFAPDQLGRFTLWVSSSLPCQVKPLAAEAAGRRTVISDIGVLPPGRDRMLAPLETRRLTRVKFIARSRLSVIGNHPVGPSPVLMTIELGQGPYKEILATSEDGSHSDAISGIRVEDFDLHPGLEDKGGAWIVLERIGGPGGQVEDHFEVEALAEERVEIGEWIVEDV
ncbi:cysteine protease [Aspergillus nanangensis]|uniref:Cysteine protease n=1 Tax=Aspergillus nanangensis TaxID=2582783 RepID=A0AAD4CHW0_ASPNN|nr:cysteine protease [Aspergillus nanangensis]